ncbi:benenodin family lasso peptide [Sphingomonas sp. NFR15]|nr:benenodin family lasso peptide [Sphingomonas sp. NFR15]SDA25274.1 hypothetical protein SAMN03159340_01853 [Sphingomonas sp. NFR15]
MERDTEIQSDVIDLGSASSVTLGGQGVLIDFISGEVVAGLSDD